MCFDGKILRFGHRTRAFLPNPCALVCLWVQLDPQTLRISSEPGHGRFFCEKLCSVHVVKGG